MGSTLRSPGRQTQPQTTPTGVIESELLRVLPAPGVEERRGSAPQTIRDLRKNVRRGINSTARTVVTLLAFSGPSRIREVITVLSWMLPRTRSMTPAELFVCETRLEGEINTCQAEEQVGTLTSEHRAVYITDLEEYQALLPQWIEGERHEAAPRRRDV